MLIIPVNNDGARTIDVDLENEIGVITFRTYWNGITQTWNLDLLDDAGNDIILGLALVIGIDILKAYPLAGDRIGQLRVISTTDDNNRTTETLGNTAQLVHFAPGEFEATFPLPDFLTVQVVDIDDVTQENIC